MGIYGNGDHSELTSRGISMSKHQCEECKKRIPKQFRYSHNFWHNKLMMAIGHPEILKFSNNHIVAIICGEVPEYNKPSVRQSRPI
jgi:hypothetical protein